jgi:hypothetical protein
MIQTLCDVVIHGVTNPGNIKPVLFGIYAVVAIAIARVLFTWARWLVR